MGKVIDKIESTVQDVKYFRRRHRVLCDWIDTLAFGAATGLVIHHIISKGMETIYPEIISEGGYEYQKTIAETVPEAYKLIKEKYPDSVPIDYPGAKCNFLLGRIKFKR